MTSCDGGRRWNMKKVLLLDHREEVRKERWAEREACVYTSRSCNLAD